MVTTKELIHRLGRPPKYTPSMDATVIDCMRQGLSLWEVGAELGVHIDTLYDWTDPTSPRYIESFSEAMKMGDMFYKAWWVKQGRTGMTNKDFNSSLWIFNAKNRIGYRDTVDVTSGGMPIQFSNQIPRPSLNEPNKPQQLSANVS